MRVSGLKGLGCAPLIAVTAGGGVVYGGREIGVAGVQPLVKRMLQQEDLPVIIQADKNVAAGVFVQVIEDFFQGNRQRVGGFAGPNRINFVHII